GKHLAPPCRNSEYLAQADSLPRLRRVCEQLCEELVHRGSDRGCRFWGGPRPRNGRTCVGPVNQAFVRCPHCGLPHELDLVTCPSTRLANPPAKRGPAQIGA